MIDGTNNVRYQFSKGLAELVFKKEPNIELATEHDQAQYLQILLTTNPHRKGNKPTGELKQTNEASRKYNEVIKTLLLLYKKMEKVPTLVRDYPSTNYWNLAVLLTLYAGMIQTN